MVRKKEVGVYHCGSPEESKRSWMVALWPAVALGVLYVQGASIDALWNAVALATLVAGGGYGFFTLGAGPLHPCPLKATLLQWGEDLGRSARLGVLLALLLYIVNFGWHLSFWESLPVGMILLGFGLVWIYRKKIFYHKFF